MFCRRFPASKLFNVIAFPTTSICLGVFLAMHCQIAGSSLVGKLLLLTCGVFGILSVLAFKDVLGKYPGGSSPTDIFFKPRTSRILRAFAVITPLCLVPICSSYIWKVESFDASPASIQRMECLRLFERKLFGSACAAKLNAWLSRQCEERGNCADGERYALEAARLAERGFRDNPGKAAGFQLKLGKLLLQHHKEDKALYSFSEAVRLYRLSPKAKNHHLIESLVGLGQAQSSLGMPFAADETFRQAEAMMSIRPKSEFVKEDLSGIADSGILDRESADSGSSYLHPVLEARLDNLRRHGLVNISTEISANGLTSAKSQLTPCSSHRHVHGATCHPVQTRHMDCKDYDLLNAKVGSLRHHEPILPVSN